MKNQLTTFVEQEAEKAEALSFCSGIKLLHIRKTVEELLSFIGKSGLFEEYSLHDISHIDEMLRIIEWIIPEKTKEQMTYAEWMMLTLSVYFHDLGMVVTSKEFENRYKSKFKEYKEKIISSSDLPEYKSYIISNDDKFLYQEFVRENHAKRIRNWIEENSNPDLGEDIALINEIKDILSNFDKMFKMDLAMICESHHKDDIDNFEKYKTNALYGNDKNEKVNLNYIAIILRIADLLHITKDRTPSVSRKIINVSNPVSVLEWEKQTAVRAVAPKAKRNSDGVIDDSLTKDTIEITAYFDGADTAEAYFGLSSYLQYTQKEIIRCSNIVAKAQKFEGTVNYDFPWKKIDESNIVAVGFETKKLQFTIAQEKILQLLVGHTLYNDSSVVVRELVQNAIDAVKLQIKYDKKNRHKATEGKILVSWDSSKRELSFSDNGTGMTVSDIENYLLKVGSSKYRDETIKKEFPDFCSISHFGIGLLTCFMIADDIDIITNSPDQDDANIVQLRKLNGNYLLRKEKKNELSEIIQKHGTIIKLHVRSDVDMSNLSNDLQKWIVLPEVSVTLFVDNEEKLKINYSSLRDVLIKYLTDKGINVDGESYDVLEKTNDNVSVAFAVKYMKYLSDWCFVRISEINDIDSSNDCLPIGTCIEGVRVEFSTPGYKSPSILAIANAQNSKYKTNVARSAIDLDGNKEILSSIYSIYQEYIQEQMDKLKQKGFSDSWALTEGKYLMYPLFDSSFDRFRIEAVDEDILVNSMANLKCLTIENEGCRECVSALDIRNLEEVNIFECEIINAIEHLFREIQCNATLKSLIGIVCTENFIENVPNVICNYDARNIIHRYALKNKEVSDIKVDRDQRRIRLTYSNQESLWYKFEHHFTRRSEKIFIPKSKFSIEGLQDEIGIRTTEGIYLSSDTEICQYLVNTINKFKENDCDNLLIDLFLSYAFNSNVLENVHNKKDAKDLFKYTMGTNISHTVGYELVPKMWDIVDAEEFSRIILTKNHTLYSINNWSREYSVNNNIYYEY